MVVKARLDGAGPVEGVPASHGLGLTQRVPRLGQPQGHCPQLGDKGEENTARNTKHSPGWAGLGSPGDKPQFSHNLETLHGHF